MNAYWDPMPTILNSSTMVNLGFDDGRILGPPEEYLKGKWEERDWRNVPGPLYGAATAACLGGRPVAPNHILNSDGDMDEIIFRQPQNEVEVQRVLSGAWTDPFSGYACDGDQCWTLDLVREWWTRRPELIEWIDNPSPWLVGDDEYGRDNARGMRDFREYIHSGLELYLRNYAFWLECGRPALPGETLPDL